MAITAAAVTRKVGEAHSGRFWATGRRRASVELEGFVAEGFAGDTEPGAELVPAWPDLAAWRWRRREAWFGAGSLRAMVESSAGQARRPVAAWQSGQTPNSSSRWDWIRKPVRRATSRVTAGIPQASISVVRWHSEQMTWWWWIGSHST